MERDVDRKTDRDKIEIEIASSTALLFERPIKSQNKVMKTSMAINTGMSKIT